VLYFDTSFLMPLILPEATSDEIAAFFRHLPAQELVVSHWTRVEFSSLLAREVRIGGMDAQAAARAAARFEAMLDEPFSILLPSVEDFDLANQYLGRFEIGLRAGDTLHLAIASNRRAEAVYTLDQILLNAGKILDLPVSGGMGTT